MSFPQSVSFYAQVAAWKQMSERFESGQSVSVATLKLPELAQAIP